jgi:hypothetical protein
MPDLLELEQQDLHDLDSMADAFLKATASLENGPPSAELANRLAEPFAHLAEGVVRLALGFAARLRPRWEEYKHAGWAGQARQVHALRDSLLRTFESRLRYLAQAIRLARVSSGLTGRAVSGSERLSGAIQDLEGLKREVFDRWSTLEDLEEMLVETHSFSAEQFDGLARHYRPPQAWYEQEESCSER